MKFDNINNSFLNCTLYFSFIYILYLYKFIYLYKIFITYRFKKVFLLIYSKFIVIIKKIKRNNIGI